MVEDVAEAFAALLEHPLIGAVDIGTGVGTSVRQVVERIGQLIGRPDLLRFGEQQPVAGDPPYVVADPSRLLSTGWQPQFTLDSGLRATIAWWQTQLSPDQSPNSAR